MCASSTAGPARRTWLSSALVAMLLLRGREHDRHAADPVRRWHAHPAAAAAALLLLRRRRHCWLWRRGWVWRSRRLRAGGLLLHRRPCAQLLAVILRLAALAPVLGARALAVKRLLQGLQLLLRRSAATRPPLAPLPLNSKVGCRCLQPRLQCRLALVVLTALSHEGRRCSSLCLPAGLCLLLAPLLQTQQLLLLRRGGCLRCLQLLALLPQLLLAVLPLLLRKLPRLVERPLQSRALLLRRFQLPLRRRRRPLWAAACCSASAARWQAAQRILLLSQAGVQQLDGALRVDSGGGRCHSAAQATAATGWGCEAAPCRRQCSRLQVQGRWRA